MSGSGSCRSGVGAESGRAGDPRARTSAESTDAHRAWSRSLATLCLACLSVATWWCAPALALSQRGHTVAVSSSFGGVGKGDGEFEFAASTKVREPVELAVDEATQDVYVVDPGNHRLQEFSAEGQFIAAWGWGVSNGEEKYEVCTSECLPGLAGHGKGEFTEPGAIAVDNSPDGRHEVYVDMNANAKRPDVQRFPANGEKPLGKLPVEEEGRLDGIAVDSQGRVWLYRGEEEETAEIEGFSDAEKPVALGGAFGPPVECPKPGFAVDAAGEDFYLDHELLNSEDECPAVVEREKAEERKGKAEGSEARPVVTTRLNPKEVLSNSESGIDRQNTTGVAVDQASSEQTPLGAIANGDVYIDNGTSVAVFTPDGSLLQRIGAGQLKQGEGIAVDSTNGDAYVVDAAGSKVDVFSPEQPTTPTVDGLWAENVASGEVKLSTEVDPRGADTSVYFQYGTVDCVVDPSECTDAPAPPGIDIGGADNGAGFGGRRAEVTLQELRPGTTYYYRVIVSNSIEGPAQGEDKFATITTPPSPQGVLADGRAWELVSPAEKGGSGIQALGEAEISGPIQAAADGSAVTYYANGPVEADPEGNRAPEATQVLSTRSPSGWSSEELVTPHEKGEGFEDTSAEYRFFSPDLSLSLVEPQFAAEPLEAPPLAPGASEKTLYVRDDPPRAPDAAEQPVYAEAEANRAFRAPGYLPLLTPSIDTAKTKFGGQLEFLDATPDLSHVVFESGEVALLSGSASGLYEWGAGGHLQLVSILPDGAPAGNAELGDTPELGAENINVRNAVSSNGTRVVFYSQGYEEHSEFAEFHRLYMRDTAAGETVQLNAAQGTIEPAGESEISEVAFQGASSDGSKVFFTDTAALTPESAQRAVQESVHNPADLYECEMVEEAGRLKCDLKDLTALPSRGSAEILNIAPGISEDGAYVYFVANGALTPSAEQGNCEATQTPRAEQRCNLYLWHEGRITLIARLSGEDTGDWGSPSGFMGVNDVEPRPDLAGVTAGVSPHGEYFAFMSKMSPTGYDNVDASAQAKGARDEEVYLYDARSRLLVCASCNSSGPSLGTHDIERSGEGHGLVVDRRGNWTGQYLAGSIPGWTPVGPERAIRQPRYLSDSGRLFFNSPDGLVADAKNGKQDVYEYEPDGVGSCTQEVGCVSLISSGTALQESAFLDTSESGDDVFFVTAQPLVGADHDTDFDVYDARVCTQASPCPSAEAPATGTCETSHACSPVTSSPPAVVLPASSTAQSTGNVLGFSEREPPRTPPVKPKPLTRQQKLAKAVRQCRHKRNRARRASCERQARKLYGGKPKSKTSATPAREQR